MRDKVKFFYGFIAVIILAITTIGATYAYWAASTASANSAVQTSSAVYSISMDITPLYHDFSIIPMDDEDALKALNNKCKDKYSRGACSAYTIDVYGYNETLEFISGYMDITTMNMQNLSYMVLRLSDTFDENKCVVIDKENYCVTKEATSIGDGAALSLGDSYEVSGMPSTKFILLMWLKNLQLSQNDLDIGEFNAIVTMQAGNGGKIQGSIASSVKFNPEQSGSGNSDSNQEVKDESGSDKEV